MSGRMNAATIGVTFLILYWGLAVLMRSLGSDMPYPTDYLPSSWRGWL
jgi:hypothetical protein